VIDQSQPFQITLGQLQLEAIYFSGTGELTGHFLELLENMGPTLKHLHLRNKSFPQSVNSATQFLRNCTGLVSLDLYGVTGTTQLIPDLLYLPRSNLKELDISYWDSGISMDHFNLLTQHPLSNLKSLTLTILNSSVVPLLTEFGKKCPKLRRLCINLDYRHLLIESEIVKILSFFNHLFELELWCCQSMSLDTIQKILTEKCPHLKKLLISTADIHNDKSPLTDEEFQLFTENFPKLQFKIWHHSIYGNRHFRYQCGYDPTVNLIPQQTSTLTIKPTQIEENGKSLVIPTVLVDNIPIWTNESTASLCHLQKTITDENGALPLISEWCCDCNIHHYNGVLFYHEGDQLIWETHEPGPKQTFRFSSSQYTTTIQQLEQLQLNA